MIEREKYEEMSEIERYKEGERVIKSEEGEGDFERESTCAKPYPCHNNCYRIVICVNISMVKVWDRVILKVV